MKKISLALLAILLLCSHDMFLKLDDYFLEPNKAAVIQLFNGTYDASENVIDRDRMLDVSLVANANRTAVDTTQWYEKENTTYLDFKTDAAGTYVAGVSTAPRNIAMDADRFNNYLEHDGVIDMLQYRKDNNEDQLDAVEKYSKHVKTIFQVGESRTADYSTTLGYPIEFIPLENPYAVHAGHELKVRLIANDKPLADQVVIVGLDADTSSSHTHAGEDTPHTHNDASDHTHNDGTSIRTDKNGIITVPLTAAGVYHLRTIYMVKSSDAGLTHESNWATLTFQIKAGDHAHGENGTHAHDNNSQTHDHEDGIPSWVFWVLSLVAVAILFLVFNRKRG